MMAVALVVFIAALIQGVMGFGGALIAMPLLVGLLGIQIATPAFAVVGLAATLLNAIHWREHVTPRDLVSLVLPAIIGIPLGVWLLSRIDDTVITRVLGVLLIFYGTYSLLGAKIRQLGIGWAYVAGFASGLLTGAYNTGGPPVILYASARQWEPERFRGNLQTFFLLSSAIAVISHGFAGHYSTEVLHTVLLAIPTLLIGQFAGVRLCRYIKAETFRKLVLVFLMILGARLLFL
jgi:uncharacterized membrane protein YfcA